MVRWSGVRSTLIACALIGAACAGGEEESGGQQQPEPSTCEPTCPAGQECVDGACVGEVLADGDGDGVPDESDRCGETAAGAAVESDGCTWEEQLVPWSEGPWGVGIRDTAGDFTVQTLSGPFVFSERWTGGESHLFLVRQAGNEYSDMIAGSDVGALLAESPPNVHYLFLDTEADEAARRTAQEALQARFEEALAALDAAAADTWRERLHFVTDAVNALDGSLGDFWADHANFAFGIDRFQRWREGGILFDYATNTAPIRFLAREALGFEYERRLERQLGSLDATEVVVFDGDRHQGGWEAGYATSVEISLPSAEEMARFDSMAVHLYTACPGHLQGLQAGCNEWDYAHNLFVCDEADPSSCGTELVRYVTPYGREGEWLTDVSPLLPLFASGGTRTLRYEGANGYDMHLRILLWDAGKPERPVELRFLYGESGAIPWNEEYNGRFEPVRFTVDDPATTRVGIYSVVTGHGFGSTFENCAEFCNSEHEFSVNGTAFTENHPEARERYGCYDRVDQGVVPNQFGSWPFGRAGWCPGQDVKPWVQDVSEALVSGENEIAYRALFRDQPYTPNVNGQGDYLPELRLQSWLVRYELR